jgi:PhnB protein
MPAKPVKPIPDGFHTVTPYMMVADAAGLIDFLVAAFGATELERHTMDGRVMHAQVKLGDSMIMMGEASPDQGGPMPASTYLYVPNVDEVHASAVAAGATSLMAPADQFYGDRSGGVKDAWGNMWWIGTHVEDVSSEEIDRRAVDAMKKK